MPHLREQFETARSVKEIDEGYDRFAFEREFYSTGDVFASVLTGGLVKGKSLTEAAREAVEFIRACAVRTVEQNLPMREGVDFEPLLGLLTERSGQA